MAVLELVHCQQFFQSRIFRDLCVNVVYDCEHGRCTPLSDQDRERGLLPCNHDIASHNARVKDHNKFGLEPFWYQEMREFDTSCREIVANCEARRCPSACKHDIASYDLCITTLRNNRHNAIPIWSRDPTPPAAGESAQLSYAPPYPREPELARELAQTPRWEPDHEYDQNPAWNPAADADDLVDSDWVIEENKYGMY
jgi:hypothetical protein